MTTSNKIAIAALALTFVGMIGALVGWTISTNNQNYSVAIDLQRIADAAEDNSEDISEMRAAVTTLANTASKIEILTVQYEDTMRRIAALEAISHRREE